MKNFEAEKTCACAMSGSAAEQQKQPEQCCKCETLQGACVGLMSKMQTKLACRARSEAGQGTTEYAILVGVLVVIAILAITVFRGKIQELWTAISDGITGL